MHVVYDLNETSVPAAVPALCDFVKFTENLSDYRNTSSLQWFVGSFSPGCPDCGWLPVGLRVFCQPCLHSNSWMRREGATELTDQQEGFWLREEDVFPSPTGPKGAEINSCTSGKRTHIYTNKLTGEWIHKWRMVGERKLLGQRVTQGHSYFNLTASLSFLRHFFNSMSSSYSIRYSQINEWRPPPKCCTSLSSVFKTSLHYNRCYYIHLSNSYELWTWW